MALSVPTRGCRSRNFSRFKALVAAFRSRCAWSTSTAGRLANTLSNQDSGTLARHNSIRLSWRLRIVRQPRADLAGFRMIGLQIEHPRVMLPSQRWVVELLSAQVGQREMGAHLVRICREQFLELVGGILRIAAVPESEGKVVTGVRGIGLERERGLVRNQCQPQVSFVLLR